MYFSAGHWAVAISPEPNLPNTLDPDTVIDLGVGQGGGGGIYLFSSYVGSGPASTLHLQKISGISSTPKNY